MTTQYIVGTTVRLQTEFTLEDGTPVDPITVTCFMLAPDGEETNLTDEVLQLSAGIYYVDFEVEQNGLHQFRFAGSGQLDVANEDYFMGQSVFTS